MHCLGTAMGMGFVSLAVSIFQERTMTNFLLVFSLCLNGVVLVALYSQHMELKRLSEWTEGLIAFSFHTRQEVRRLEDILKNTSTPED